MAIAITPSKQVKPRHLKLLFWGNTGTRKTESILRHFPAVLFIDIEGNAEHCTQMEEIPEFLYVRTKDLDEIIDLIDQVAAGRIKMPDGSPVLTVALDSVSVLWTIRQDTRAVIAEARAARFNRSAEDANFTQLDWTMAKRPLVRLNARLNNCPIKYVVFTAREQDAYQNDDARKDVIRKIGVKPAAIKGLEYEMNVVLHMRFPEPAPGKRGPWECEVTKVQGALGRQLPVGQVLREFPAATLLSYTGHLTGQGGAEQDEQDIAERHAARESAAPRSPAAQENPHMTAVTFYAAAAEMGYRLPDGSTDTARIKQVLNDAGYDRLVQSRLDEMLGVLRSALEPNQAPAPENGKSRK
jgi:hypothetical protein